LHFIRPLDINEIILCVIPPNETRCDAVTLNEILVDMDNGSSDSDIPYMFDPIM